MNSEHSKGKHAPSRTGIVVIGRNEGARLESCLSSLSGVPCPILYVDSGSTDNSTAIARSLCDQVLELDPRLPFSAARARNEGFVSLLAAHPQLEYVQFIDGDSVLLPGWLDAARGVMDGDPARAATVGPLRERAPEVSIYNRLCDLEWRSPVGELSNFGALGGLMFVRAAVFARLGGFNERVIAGEDSEFGIRVALAGLKVTKIDSPMAIHDADIRRFAQWWWRAIRSGYAIGQRFQLHGRGPLHDCAHERRSVLFWGIAVPATIVALVPFTWGLSALLALGYAVLWQRVARFRRRQGDSPEEAALYARFTVLGKFAEACGLLSYCLNSLVGRHRLIEYK